MCCQKNNDIKEKILRFYVDQSNRKGKASSIQLELEKRLKNFEKHFASYLNRNYQLERNLVQVKEDLQKSPKGTTFSKILSNLTN